MAALNFHSELALRFQDFFEGKDNFTDDELHDEFGDEYPGLVPFINHFASQRRLGIYRTAMGSLGYMVKSKVEAAKYAGLDQDHMHVLQEITAAGNKGVWTRNIKFKTKLQQGAINKILKNLEQRQLVKAVKSIASKNKKVYMLFNLVPAREHTGGPWYTDQEFDTEFVAVIRKHTLNLIKALGAQRGLSVAEVTKKLSESSISKTVLKDEDVKVVLDTLVYDGTVNEVQVGVSLEKRYVLAPTVHATDFYSETPCCCCPVAHMCTEGGLISPLRCEYMSTWLGADINLQF